MRPVPNAVDAKTAETAPGQKNRARIRYRVANERAVQSHIAARLLPAISLRSVILIFIIYLDYLLKRETLKIGGEQNGTAAMSTPKRE